jgi:alpha-glucosidase
VDLGENVLAFRVSAETGPSILVIANVGGEFVALPDGAEVLVSSSPIDAEQGLPTDTAAWVTVP